MALLAALSLLLVATDAHAATADPSQAARAKLIGSLEDVTGANGSRYTARDDLGLSLDTLKIIPAPAGGYVGVYHAYIGGVFYVRVATSSDLLSWHYRATLDASASQPTIAALSGGQFLVAYEKSSSGRHRLRLRAYRSFSALTAGSYYRQFTAALTLSSIAEGTPSISSAQLTRGLDRSQISVGFHYLKDGYVDRQARGVLTNFSSWKASVATDLNSAFSPTPGGNIGDRDHLTFEGYKFTIIEAQSVRGDWSSWRVYLYDHTARRMYPLTIRTHGGSVAFGNPSATEVMGPGGKRALAVSLFLFYEGAAAGEAGPLIFYKEY